jgi:excisionase family DNA binding protein
MALYEEETASSQAEKNSEFVSNVGWVRKKDIARHLSLSVRSIDNLIARKAIPFCRLGASVRFRVADVDRALERFVRKEVR